MSPIRKALSVSLALAILSTLVEGRKYDNGSRGEIDWIAPASGSLAASGQSLTATWRTEGQVYSPSFALCTSGDAGDDCGNESWPAVTDNGDGTYSASLTMPVVAQGMNGLYLSMKGDDGSINTSPNFGIDGGTGAPNAYLASAAVPSLAPTQSLTSTEEEITAALSTASASSWQSTSAVSQAFTKTKTTMRTTISAPATHTIPMTTASPVLYPTPMQAYSQAPQVQAQAPLQVTAPIAASDPTATSIEAETVHHPASKPSATAIALPLALCGLILISALIFCARSRIFRKPGLGKDVEKWQDIVKEQAAASAAASASASTSTLAKSASEGVEVRQRNDNPYKGYTDPEVPAFGYRGREASHDGYTPSKNSRQQYENSSSGRSERFTAIPEVNYDRRRDRARGGGGRDRSRTDDRPRSGGHNHSRQHRQYSHASLQRDRPFDDRCNSSNPRDYYSTSRRSSSGIGGVYDNYNDLERQGGCDCSHWHSRSTHLHSHSSSRQSSRSDPHPSRGSRSSTAREPDIRRPSAVQNDSFGPLSNPHDHGSMHFQASSNGRRPLPQPIIRSSTLTSRGSSLDPFADMPRQKTLPHVTGGLRDEHDDSVRIRGERHHHSSGVEYTRRDGHETPTEAGWDMDLPLAGEGAYRTGDEGMGELYESLRRAIAARG
ncbi:hypothetical protein I317_01722 [Kwoniella heveanensis CBS 569]|nr:hypothetical protein I317_01722 [Kwoniella heveanensis CBS 569]